MWNTNLKFLKDGEYLIELTYVFYKVDDRRNPWDIDDNVFGSQGYISFNDNIIESNLDFVYRNGYYSGLIEEPTVNGNNKVPLIHKALIPVTVVNGNCTIEDEHLQKTNVLVQDLTYKSTYVNNKYEVKYSSNNISFNWLINYKGINFNESRQDFSNQFLYPKLDSGTTVNKGQFLLHLAIMSGWYDGTGNYNDWLMAFLLQYCIYPISKDYYTKKNLNLDKLIDRPNKNDLLIVLQQITTKEEFDKLFNSKNIKKMIIDDKEDLMFAISRNDSILNIMYNHYKKKLSGASEVVRHGKYIILEVSSSNAYSSSYGETKRNGRTLNEWSYLKGKFQYFKKYSGYVDYIRNDTEDDDYVYYYDFEI
jgi:hypothetical protein